RAFGQREAGTLQILAEWLGVLIQRADALRQLRLSESQYRLLFAANPLPMWVFDTETLRFLAVNDTAVARYGYTKDEFLAMTIKDIRPKGAAPVIDRYRERGDPGGQIAGVWTHRIKDGRLIDVEISSNAIRFGARAGRLVLAHDVTERKRAERQLQKTEAVLEIAGRVAHVAGWTYDLKDRVFAYSDELCALHDMPAGSAVSLKQALDFYAPESRAAMRVAVNACAVDGTPYDLELELITARGRCVGVRTIGQPVRDPSGTIVGTQGAVQDISEKKVAAEQVRALAAQLSKTVESITDAFFTLDRDWRFTYVNAEAERLSQRTRTELMGRVIWDVIPGAGNSEFERQYRLAVETNRSVDFEAYLAPRRRWREVHAYPSETGLTVYLRDVTERHGAQEQLRLLETCVAWMTDVVIITEAAAPGSADPKIVFVNDAFVRCTGYARNEVLGRTPRLLQGPRTQRSELDRVAAALRRSEPVRAELINYKKDGAEYWVEMEIVPVRSAGGESTHFVAVQRNTTERRATQEALRSLNENLEAKVAERTLQLELTNGALASKEEEIRSVVEHMADSVINFDDDGVIRSANPMVEAIFGYAVDEVVGRNIATLVPALGPRVDDGSAGHATREARGLHRSGAGLALEVAVSQYRIRGQRLWTAILRDIGERVAIMA
ncbi:MAG: PAS domain S-box protein, partial [Caldimonas sp.]